MVRNQFLSESIWKIRRICLDLSEANNKLQKALKSIKAKKQQPVDFQEDDPIVLENIVGFGVSALENESDSQKSRGNREEEVAPEGLRCGPEDIKGSIMMNECSPIKKRKEKEGSVVNNNEKNKT